MRSHRGVPMTPEQVAAKVLAEVKKFERLAFGAPRTKNNGALAAIAEAGPVPDEVLYRLDRLCGRAREFVAAGRAAHRGERKLADADVPTEGL